MLMTDKQTERQTSAIENIISLSEIVRAQVYACGYYSIGPVMLNEKPSTPANPALKYDHVINVINLCFQNRSIKPQETLHI